MYDFEKHSMDRLFLYLVCTTLCSHITHGAFTWLKQPIDNEVHACVGGEAMFRWHYDESIYNVTMVYWRNANTGEMVLGHHILPDEQLEHYFDKYRYRVMLMDPTEANAGLVLMEVTADDAGEYRVELSGPVQAVDTARLIVHSEINPVVSIGYEELTLDQFATVRKEINWTSEVNITFRSGNVPVDISMELGEDATTCTARSECFTKFTPDSEKTEAELRIRIAQEGCSPQTFTLYVADESSASKSDWNETAVIVAVVIVVTTLFIAVVIALDKTTVIVVVVFVVISLLIVVVIAIFVMRQEKKRRQNADVPVPAGAPATDEFGLRDVINEDDDTTPKLEEETCNLLLKPKPTAEYAKDTDRGTMGTNSDIPGKPNVVLTGFGPFGRHAINASSECVKYLRSSWNPIDFNLIFEPDIQVDEEIVKSETPKLWGKYHPKLMVHVGLSSGVKKLTLERLAHNEGYHKGEKRIKYIPSSPSKISSNLDMQKVCDEINKNNIGVKAVISCDPGRYCCNFIYLVSLNIDKCRTAFVHVPPLNKPYTKQELAEGIKVAVLAMLRQLDAKGPQPSQSVSTA